jgi:membrane fusion protein (multidrug efflux system)
MRLVIFAVVGVIIVGWLAKTALHVYHYVETDNAYVVGHLHMISPQIDGQVKSVLVEDNQAVKAGTPLVRLDTQEFDIAVQKAQAAVAQAKAQEQQVTAATAQLRASHLEAQAKVAQSEAMIAQADAQLNLTKLTLGRSEQLLRNGGATTQADVDNTRAAFDAAQANTNAASANRDAARASVESAAAALVANEAQIVAAKANVAAAEAAEHDAERKLSYTTLVASADGHIGNRNVEAGNRVVAGQSLLALAENDVWIAANFKETQLPLMKVGQDVELSVDALPGQVLHGKIDSISPASGARFALLPPDNATGNFNKVVQRIPVKIVLDGESRAAASELRLGYSVVVNVRVR